MAHLDLIDWNVVALEAIQRREPVHSARKLAKGAGRRTTEGKEASDAEYRRRTGIRQLNEELSQYYPIFDRQEWECLELLSKGKQDRDHS